MSNDKPNTGAGEPKKDEKDEMVLTPGGWRPKSTIHHVEPGHHISGKGGRFQKIHTASGRVVEDYGEFSTGPAEKAPRRLASKQKTPAGGEPYPDNGWIVDAQWNNTSSTPISYFSTEWVVPPVPATEDNQTIYLFNGITPTDDSYILQPVLQWGTAPGNMGATLGGNYWQIGNWYVPYPGSGNPLFYGNFVKVNPGDSLQGVMTLTGQSAGTFNYKSSFLGYPTADLNVTDVEEQTIAYETLECYDISQASDYPNALMTAMTNIELQLQGGTEASLDWTPTNTVTENGQQCVVVSNASPGGDVYIFYATDPQNFYFVVDKSTFGTDEVSEVIAGSSAGRFFNAFWLVLEGYTPNWIAGATPTFAGASTFNPTNISGLSIAPDATFVEYELGGPGSAYGDSVQRIRFAYDITFSNISSFPHIGSEATYTLLANISIAGRTLSIEPETIFELIGGADPYFTNVDPNNADSVPYLSQDLRVFTVTAGQSPVPGAPAFSIDAYGSIQGFLYYLNNTALYTQPYPSTGPDPLNNLPKQSGYETGETSVTPLTSGGQQNYNFALARVRLQGAGGTNAPNVRVFFRLWVAVSFDTDFDPNTTYASQPGTSGADLGLPVFPLASGTGLVDPSGQSLQTIPFFATNSTGSNDYKTSYPPPGSMEDNNIQTITIPMGQDSVFTYFGCFLDVYTPTNQSKFPGTHHCLVAQIAYDEAPIPTVTPSGATPSPENWDQLAQRNLQITSSGQPGFPITHRIPQTFDSRPSPLPVLQSDGTLLNYPDELMIDWGNTPLGSVASIYWPQVNSAQVLRIASRLYTTHCLSAFDANTIQCTITGEVTYIPIPNAAGQNFAGLFTIDLPNGIHAGELFTVTVRRLVSQQAPVGVNIPGPNAIRDPKRLLNWRSVAGTFEVKIPVSYEEPLLLPEENTLAIMKWRLQNMSTVYRWYPVVQRYISYISARVKGMGGHPSTIAPSQWGVIPPAVKPPHLHPPCDELVFTGKVSAIIYDRFGDFDGFLLLTVEGHEHEFKAREPEVEEIVNRAWSERMMISVFVEQGKHHIPSSIVLRGPSWPHHY